MKSEEEAENLWMKDFWNRIETVQNVWKEVDQFIKCQIKRPATIKTLCLSCLQRK